MVCEKLVVPVILGGDFCATFLEGTYLQRRYVVVYDASTIPIFRRVPAEPARESDAPHEPPELKETAC